ncbi:MAG: L,D-transpeptidase [Gemmatimonadota bacterium]
MSWRRGSIWRTAALAGALAATAVAPGERPNGPAGEASEARAERATLRLVVNIESRRLHVYVDGRRTRSYPVAVGKPTHPTPTGRYRITHAVWNPWWHPPDRGWAAGASPAPPGPGNPMGRVKMYFRPLYFIHGTPDVASLGRAASHGCIRMSNADAIELARLVHRHGDAAISSSDLEWLIDHPRETRTVRLRNPVTLEIVRQRADVDMPGEPVTSSWSTATGGVAGEAAVAERGAGSAWRRS